MKTFLDMCLSGEAKLEDVDDFVDAWREGKVKFAQLHDALGLTLPEYGAWILRAESLNAVLVQRRLALTNPVKIERPKSEEQVWNEKQRQEELAHASPLRQAFEKVPRQNRRKR